MKSHQVRFGRVAKTVGKDLWLNDGGARGAGRLFLRVRPGSRRLFHYRSAGRDGIRVTMPLGPEGHPKSLTLPAAR